MRAEIPVPATSDVFSRLKDCLSSIMFIVSKKRRIKRIRGMD